MEIVPFVKTYFCQSEPVDNRTMGRRAMLNAFSYNFSEVFECILSK